MTKKYKEIVHPLPELDVTQHPDLVKFAALYNQISGEPEKPIDMEECAACIGRIAKMAFEAPRVYMNDPGRLQAYLDAEKKANSEMYRLLHLTRCGAFIEKLKGIPAWSKQKIKELLRSVRYGIKDVLWEYEKWKYRKTLNGTRDD